MDTPRPPRKALLLDDNMISSGPVAAGLKSLGYDCRIAAGEAGARSYLAENKPDLVVVYLGCARCDAAGFVRWVRAEYGDDLPILGYCGHSEVGLIKAGRAAGADLVAPNSAMRGDLDRVLAALAAGRERRSAAPDGGGESCAGDS